MPDEIDWSVTTYQGNRRRQHEEFRALPFREKLRRIEQSGEVAGFFASQRAAAQAQPEQQGIEGAGGGPRATGGARG